MKNNNLAIADLSKAIELNPKSARAYYYRGKSKKYKNDINGSCEDLKVAKTLGSESAADELKENHCN